MTNKYLNRYRWIIASLIIVSIGFLFYPSQVLLLSDVRRDTGLILPVREQAGFTIEYTHSVQKTKVQEHFVFAPDNQIVLTSTTFQSLGVGLPFLPSEGKLVNNNGVFSLTEINRKFEFITIGFMPIAKQSIILNDKIYKFEDYFTAGSFIKISYENMFPIGIVWQKWLGGKEVLYE